MRTGKSLTELAQELMTIQTSKVDLIVPSQSLKMNPEAGLYLEGDVPSNVPAVLEPTNWAHQQIATYSNIPKAYYDRVKKEDPSIIAMAVNHGIQMAINKAISQRKPEKRMVRTVSGKVRGFLSSRYRMLDCSDLLETVLPVLKEHDFRVVSSELTDRRMYLKVITDRIKGEVRKGMTVQYGLVISSSDVGAGSVRVEPLLYECVCDNGMICQTAMRKFHIGKDQGSESIEELLTDATKEKDDAVFWMKAKDIVVGSMSELNFQREMDLLRSADETKIENFNLDKVVDLTMKEVGVTGEGKKHSILEYLASGADGRGLTQYGLANSFTYAAHDAQDVSYEEATELERAGGKIIVMGKKKWEEVACSR